jgi:hypothetical protein
LPNFRIATDGRWFSLVEIPPGSRDQSDNAGCESEQERDAGQEPQGVSRKISYPNLLSASGPTIAEAYGSL